MLKSSEEIKKEVAEIPKETKQAFLDKLHQGLTIGAAREAVGLDDLMVACEIINENIHDHKHLGKNAV